jgi:hypothetical protein
LAVAAGFPVWKAEIIVAYRPPCFTSTKNFFRVSRPSALNVPFDVFNRELDAGRLASLMETMLFAYTLKIMKREAFL